MAWLRGSASSTAINGGNVTIDLSTIGLVEGDVVYVVGAIPTNTAGLALPGDWSTLDEQNAGAGRGIIGRKVMGATPDTSVVLTGDGDAASSVGAFAYAFAGVDTTTPEDGVALTFASGSSTNPDAGSITPGSTGGICLVMAWSRVNDGTFTAPTGYNTAVGVVANADTNDVTIGAAYKFGMVSGVAENPGAFGGWSTGDWGAWTLSIRTSADQPKLRGFATSSNTNGGNVTIDLTTITGLAENDIVFLMGAAGETSANIAIPGDWTTVDEQSNLSAARGIIGWKKMGSSVDTSVVITNNGGSTSATTGIAVAFYNVDGTTPLDGVTPTYANIATGTAPNNPSVTPGTSNSLVIAASYCQVNDVAVTAPANYLYVGGVGSTDTTPTSINIAIRGGRVASVAENPDVWGGWTGHSGNWSIVLRFGSTAAAAVVTGTATASITEADVVAGGKTIIITLTGDTWLTSAGGLFDAIRQDIIDGLDSAQAEGTGWNAEVRDNQGVSGVVRTSDTVVTITLDAQAAYNITAQETITVTVPLTALTLGIAPITASPTFTVSHIATTSIPVFRHHYLMQGSA